MNKPLNHECFRELQATIRKYGMEAVLICMPEFFGFCHEDHDIETRGHLWDACNAYANRYEDESEQSAPED